MNGLPVEKCLELATTAAAICVTRPGASDSVPMAAEVEEIIAKGELGKLEIKEL